MIDLTLEFLAKELDHYLKSRFQSKDSKVIVGSLMTKEGKANSKVEDMVVITLLNIVEEKTNQSNSTHYARAGSKTIGRISPPVNLNLNILITANFKEGNYNQSLKFISGVIGYFQVNRNFTRGAFPHMMEGVERMTMEIVNMDADSLHNMWGMVGSKYLPSMVYRLRSIRIQEAVIKEQVTPITGLQPETEL